jgi:hypothetical protein
VASRGYWKQDLRPKTARPKTAGEQSPTGPSVSDAEVEDVERKPAEVEPVVLELTSPNVVLVGVSVSGTLAEDPAEDVLIPAADAGSSGVKHAASQVVVTARAQM